MAETTKATAAKKASSPVVKFGDMVCYTHQSGRKSPAVVTHVEANGNANLHVLLTDHRDRAFRNDPMTHLVLNAPYDAEGGSGSYATL